MAKETRGDFYPAPIVDQSTNEFSRVYHSSLVS